MKEYIILICIIFICLGFGFVIGRFGLKKHIDGTVVIEQTEDGKRDRIRFVLDLELDEIKSKTQLVLKVENDLSKNSQVI